MSLTILCVNVKMLMYISPYGRGGRMTVSKLTLNIPAELKVKLKLICVHRGVNMTDVIVELLRNYVDQPQNNEKDVI